MTQVLQQTMTSEQTFYLEKWRQRMILELGEDGFAEYTSSNLLNPDSYGYYVSQSRRNHYS